MTSYWEGQLCFKNPDGQEIKTKEEGWVEGEADDSTHYVWWRSPKSKRLCTRFSMEIPGGRKRGRD